MYPFHSYLIPNISNIHIFKRVYKNVEFHILIYYIILVCMLTRIFRYVFVTLIVSLFF